MILLSCVLGTETHWFSTWHGTVAAQIWLDIFTLAGEKVPSQAGSVPARFIKASWASTAWLGMILERFGHVYTATANRAEPCWYRAGVGGNSVPPPREKCPSGQYSLVNIVPPGQNALVEIVPL